MSFSAMVELVGIKDLAEDNPLSYQLKASEFIRCLKEVALKANDTIIYGFRDHCYIQNDNNLDEIISFLMKLRKILAIRSNLLIRGALAKGSLGGKSIDFHTKENSKKSNSIIQGFQFEPLASELFGMTERVKGVGISVHESLPKEFPESKKYFLHNFFITDSRIRRYDYFLDIVYEDDFLIDTNLRTIINALKQSRVTSKKLARFFIPPLINWARSFSLDKAEPHESFDKLVTNGTLNKIRDVIGVELIYFTLMDRIYGPETETKSFSPERVEILNTFFKKCLWAQNLLREDEHPVLIPKKILRSRCRRKFAQDLYVG